jgi:predicted nucleic acid-binding protein
LTLYVESNFVLEIALGQEQAAAAEKLLDAAETGEIEIAIPGFSLSEPFSRVTRTNRERSRIASQFDDHVNQMARSAPHHSEVKSLREIPSLVATIIRRETDLLIHTIERILAVSRQLNLNLETFNNAMTLRKTSGMTPEDAIVIELVIADLLHNPSNQRHLFANRNRKDFSEPAIASSLSNLGCDLVWSFDNAAKVLGVR